MTSATLRWNEEAFFSASYEKEAIGFLRGVGHELVTDRIRLPGRAGPSRTRNHSTTVNNVQYGQKKNRWTRGLRLENGWAMSPAGSNPALSVLF